MTPDQFCYWLQGYFELSPSQPLSEAQVEVIRDHLNLVFEHVLDREHDKGDPEAAKTLQEIHDGKKPKTPFVFPPKYRC